MLISAVQQTHSDIWNSPGTNTRVGSLSLIQGIFLIQGSNSGLLRSMQIFFFFITSIFIYFYFFPFIFISWRLITLQYCSGFCHTLTWISHGFTCIPHPDPPSHPPLHLIPLGLPSAPGRSTCLMHPYHLSHQDAHKIHYFTYPFSLRL